MHTTYNSPAGLYDELTDEIPERVLEIKNKILHAKPTVCTERARHYTEVYREHAAKPVLIKRALALKETLEQMTIYIDPDECIVGNNSSARKAAPIFPEYAVHWIKAEIDEFDKRPGDRFYLTEDDKKTLLEIADFWEGKTLYEKGVELMTDELQEIHDSKIIRAEGNLTSGDGHIAVHFEKILQQGINGYLQRVHKNQKQLDIATQDGLKKNIYYRATRIALEGLQHFIERFEELSLKESRSADDTHRGEELSEISRVCGRIKSGAPRSFHDALQLTYFIQLVLQIESNGHSVSLGRMDQYLHPFYEKDIKSGHLTREYAMELLENVWLKLLSINKIRSWSHTRYSAGSPLYQNVTIGGQTTDGMDAVNELSYLILNTVGKLKLTQPNLSVRYHSGTSDEFMTACMRVIEKGFGMPAFNNDEIVIPGLLKRGVEKEDAYNYSAIGCIEIAVPGKWGYRTTGMSFLNFMRVFLAALRNGYDSMSGKTFHRGTGSLTEFQSFGELMEAWREQVRAYTRDVVAIDTAVDTALEMETPDLLCSAFIDDCIDRGKTLKEGGAKYDFISGLQVGIANLANSLAAIRKLVFEEERISAEELMRHLEENFEGPDGEIIRQQLLKKVPKYGNDDNYTDELIQQAYGHFIEELSKYHNTRYGRGPIGGAYYAGTSSISANVPSGAAVPATPDGRKAYTPLAEGSSPSSGTDVLGPTAVFKSVAKLPTDKIFGGVLLNQKLSPKTIEKDQDKQKVVDMLRTFFDSLCGWHVQYNIVSRETLEEAKQNPDEHRDLVVRVAGYSAFFTTLSPDTQDDIIARTEHTL